MKKIIRLYYAKRPLVEPPSLHLREIAVVSLEDGVYIRHLAFPSMARLYQYILEEKTPLHLYYSSALYDEPSASDMKLKGWRGSELIFDIDVDHLPGCGKKLYACPDTGNVYEQNPGKCPGGREPVEVDAIEPECFDRGIEQARALVEVLRDELGFKQVKVYFSGNRGFHVRVSDDEALGLTRETRALISDYVACAGLERERLFPAVREGSAEFAYFTKEERGIRKRVLRHALKQGLAEPIGDAYRAPASYVDALLEQVCVKIDRVVTMDVSRLSRFEGSINGKAGLRVIEVDIYSGERFDFSAAFAWSGKVAVKPLLDLAGLPVLDAKVDLSRGSTMLIDAPYAVNLILRGLAQYISDKGVEPRVG